MKLKLANQERTDPHGCLKCGHLNDAASGIVAKHAKNIKKPKPGDISVCLYCGHVMVFNDDLSYRELVPEEKRILALDQKFQITLAAVNEAIWARSKH